jgi:hypothetical protein
MVVAIRRALMLAFEEDDRVALGSGRANFNITYNGGETIRGTSLFPLGDDDQVSSATNEMPDPCST